MDFCLSVLNTYLTDDDTLTTRAKKRQRIDVGPFHDKKSPHQLSQDVGFTQEALSSIPLPPIDPVLLSLPDTQVSTPTVPSTIGDLTTYDDVDIEHLGELASRRSCNISVRALPDVEATLCLNNWMRHKLIEFGSFEQWELNSRNDDGDGDGNQQSSGESDSDSEDSGVEDVDETQDPIN
ncbi:hypothetical protein EJ04DRAFT_565140 [Polyplosphaeria fusca]|uniref:Uncharacterized protein n=1 Tax=Polyplosphaeria fusca TaxID=682080 RepID=A0A9P4QYH8_9PLEO|nr:hypothetical protein EJ04DRAFT_565140 [Polyplosphaeria fusca]